MNLKELKREIPCKWRVQSFSKFKAKAVCIPYIDVSTVTELLDGVCGADNWKNDYKEINGNLYGGIAILISGDWVWKWDVGTKTEAEPAKGEASDAFKRAATKWGIGGKWLRDMPVAYVNASEKKTNDNYPYPVFDNGDRIYDLTKVINSRKPQRPQNPQPPKNPPPAQGNAKPVVETPKDPEQAEIDRLAGADKGEVAEPPKGNTDMPENFFEFMNKAKNLLKKAEKEDMYLDALHGEGVKSLTELKDNKDAQAQLRTYIEALLKEEGLI